MAPEPAGLRWCNGSLSFGPGAVHVDWAFAPTAPATALGGVPSSAARVGAAVHGAVVEDAVGMNRDADATIGHFRLVVNAIGHSAARVGHVAIPLALVGVNTSAVFGTPTEAAVTVSALGVLPSGERGMIQLKLEDCHHNDAECDGIVSFAGERDGKLWYKIDGPQYVTFDV